MTAVYVKIGPSYKGPRYRGAIKYSAKYHDNRLVEPKTLFAYHALSDDIEKAYAAAIKDIQWKKEFYLKSDRWTVTDTETGFTAINKESGSRNTYEHPLVVDLWN